MTGQRLVEVAAAPIVLAATLVVTASGPDRLTIVDAVIAAVACASLLGVGRRPYLALVISVLAAEFYMARTNGGGSMLIVLAPLCVLYRLADTNNRRQGLLLGGLAVLALAGVHLLVKPQSQIGPENIALAALGALAVAAGNAARTHRLYVAEVEERARHAEHTRESEARRRVSEERLRIARDLHDSVGHHLALINVQAGVARHLLATKPAAAQDSLAHVESACRDALAELRDTIGLLREPGEGPAPVEPVAGLAGLTELIGSFRRSGLRIEQEIGGPTRRLPPSADLTAYRVIQESLTNVCKHSDRRAARVHLRYEPMALHIAVDSDGPKPKTNGTGGHGIAGMRERVTAIGGNFHAGPQDAGGFRVSATLPFDTESR